MSDTKKCIRCGGTRLEPGALGSFSLTFRPKNTPFLTMASNDVAVDANMCLDCGTVEFVGDVVKARKLMGERAKPH
ncbi:MAG TPA: hypothetical protein VD997_09065 [Phycisphaerales bacterium]|nr:hypothetical protein [Phycisphaerales bacterium]